MSAKDREYFTKFVDAACEILGIGKPVDILKLCKIASIFEHEIKEQAFAAGSEYERKRMEEIP